jgi:hypothetical protein
MAQYEYHGLKLIQREGAPPLYLTSAPAAELLEWCDVPRAKGDFMAGYQRTLDKRRVGDLATYLRLSPKNIVPGAIIVAVDEDYISIDEANNGMCSLRIAEDTRSFEQKLQELWGAFSTRLGVDELGSAGLDVSTPGALVSPEVGSDAIEATDAPHDDDDTSADSLDDDDDDGLYPTSYLASLTKEITAALHDMNALPISRQEAIRSYIEGVSKPGLIIDGQHRVFGAKDVVESAVRPPVVLLPGLTFSEQVFQFYVLNSKARPLRPTELRRIISTSLSNEEIAGLYARFKAAGVQAEEARWTLEMDQSPSSPFRGRINFGFDQAGSIIPENVADQVVRGFMKMSASKYRQLTAPLGDRWVDPDKRLEAFFWFWSAIRNEYDDAWKNAEAKADAGEKSQLFMKVTLLTLQTFILDRFVTALPYRSATDLPPLSARDEVAKMVKSTLTNLPAEFFEREWKMKQIDTSEGRRQLARVMEDVWNNQGKMHGNLALFRG